MSDEIMLIIGDDGEANLYDDTYDITIHCESNEEQDEVRKALENIPHWIPCGERLPEDGKQVLVYARGARYALAKYDEMMEADGSYKKQWVTFDAWKPLYTIKEVMAWMPLPEPYKEVI